MNKIIIVCVLWLYSFSAFAQGYKTHKVQSGETIESVAKTYLVTPHDILALNPDAKDFKEGIVLIIPNSKVKNAPVEAEQKEIIGYKKHKVRRKETLFSISQKYGISIEEIKKANRELYSENLRKGKRLRIPQFKTVIKEQPLNNTIKKYTVLPKEGKWRIAYKFGISVPELEALNPNMNAVIQPGDELNVPNISNTEEKAVDTNYDYYSVLPKEGFYRLKVKLGLTQEELETLNPELKTEGLKAGMVLKIPKNIDVEGTLEDTETTSLKHKLVNFETKKLALLMPYRLNLLDVDSVEITKTQIKNSRLLSVVLDFHAGVQMALDSAKQMGISTELKVFDTQYQAAVAGKLLRENDLSDYDAVIGPMNVDAVNRVASGLRSKNIPVVVPLTVPKEVYGNVFQAIPKDKLMRKTMLDFVKKDSIKSKVVIISDQKHRTSAEALKQEFPGSKVIYSRKNKKGRDQYFIYEADLFGVFDLGKTVVILETDNNELASNAISLLNGQKVSGKNIVLVTLDKNKAFDKNIDNFHLSNLEFHYPSFNKNYDENKSKGFVEAYKKEHGVVPNKYVARGFDVTMDVLMRLAYKDDLYNASIDAMETEYLENKFRYNKLPYGGFVNEAVYIVKYDDLKIVNAN